MKFNTTISRHLLLSKLKNYIVVAYLVQLVTGCSILKYENIPLAPVENNKIAVFDIDGTLTPNNIEIFTSRKDAAQAVTLFKNKGYQIVYLSARVKLLQATIPNFLSSNNFPDGITLVPSSDDEQDQPDKFKIRVLNEFKTKGWTIAVAYGNSSTDFAAYEAVGIPQQNVFALRKQGDSKCEQGKWNSCLTEWGKHLDAILNKF